MLGGRSNYEEKWERLKANLLATSPKKLLQKVPNRSCRAGAWFSLNRRWAAADRTNSELEQGLTPQPRGHLEGGADKSQEGGPAGLGLTFSFQFVIIAFHQVAFFLSPYHKEP